MYKKFLQIIKKKTVQFLNGQKTLTDTLQSKIYK